MKARYSIAALAALMLAAAPTFAQTKVATANPIKILNELAETKEINKAMETEQAAFKQQVSDREAKLKDLQAQRDQLKPDAPQWADLNKQLVEQRTQAQAWAQTSQQEQARKFRDQAKRMNDKIIAAIKDVATAEKIDIVVADQKPELTDQQMENLNPTQVMQALFGRNVLFAADTIDLTQKVIAKLDAAYKAK